MIRRLMAIRFIFGCSTIVWWVLAGVTYLQPQINTDVLLWISQRAQRRASGVGIPA